MRPGHPLRTARRRPVGPGSRAAVLRPPKCCSTPHARAITGAYNWGAGRVRSRPRTTQAPHRRRPTAPRHVHARRRRPTPGRSTGATTARPRTPLAETIIYETHVKGFTMLHPGVPEEFRGTYAGLAHPAAIEHLTDLGVTAVELMPVHQFVQDAHLREGPAQLLGLQLHRLLRPARRVLRRRRPRRPGGRVQGHGEGAARGRHRGHPRRGLQPHRRGQPPRARRCRFKGIDNASYYRLVEGDRAHYFDTTGTGNSLNVSHPAALGLIMDSLRYWVTEMHVDGFRFDLATTLTRQGGDAEPAQRVPHPDPAGPDARAGQA